MARMPPLTAMRRSTFMRRGNLGALIYSRRATTPDPEPQPSTAGEPIGLLLLLTKAS